MCGRCVDILGTLPTAHDSFLLLELDGFGMHAQLIAELWRRPLDIGHIDEAGSWLCNRTIIRYQGHAKVLKLLFDVVVVRSDFVGNLLLLDMLTYCSMDPFGPCRAGS